MERGNFEGVWQPILQDNAKLLHVLHIVCFDDESKEAFVSETGSTGFCRAASVAMVVDDLAHANDLDMHMAGPSTGHREDANCVREQSRKGRLHETRPVSDRVAAQVLFMRPNGRKDWRGDEEVDRRKNDRGL